MSFRDKVKALQEELAGLPGVKIVIFSPDSGGPIAAIEKAVVPGDEEMNFDGGDDGEGGTKVFGVNSLGLPAKTMAILEENGYETVQELQDAVEDGSFEELKGVTNPIFKRVQKALEEFKANHPEAGGEDEDGDKGAEDGGDDSGGDDDSWKVGDKCQVSIENEWYPGTVKKIDLKEEKLHIHFDDGDKDWYPIDEVETLPEEE